MSYNHSPHRLLPLMLSLRLLSPLRSSLRLSTGSPRLQTTNISIAAFTTTARAMTQEYKVKGLSSLSLRNGDKQEVELEGIEGGKALILKIKDQIHATSANCTHYGAPLAKGVLTPEGRLTCPWHGGESNARCDYFAADRR